MDLPILHRMTESLPKSQATSSPPPSSSSKLTESVPLIEILKEQGDLNEDEIVKILNVCNPSNIEEYSEHLLKVCTILYEDKIDRDNFRILEAKFIELTDHVLQFMQEQDFMTTESHLIIEKCFDILILMATDGKSFALASRAIRFLTQIIMGLTYWQIYNLLLWKPAIYQFLLIIHFDLEECYNNFIRDYSAYVKKQVNEQRIVTRSRAQSLTSVVEREAKVSDYSEDDQTEESDSDQTDDFPFIQEKPKVKRQKKVKKEDKPQAVGQSYLKSSGNETETTDNKWQTNKSANYDPEVVHECQLPAPDEPGKMCLRRFSRKYELIRHQETVHSKKKKLFKCYVCIKQTPNVLPRIFTRHDTLAKHIRVNHKISGREAKAEVQFSKKHAEIVEEGDITVQVGRRKTKVDYDLRAHLEMERTRRDGSDPDSMVEGGKFDESDDPESIIEDIGMEEPL